MKATLQHFPIKYFELIDKAVKAGKSNDRSSFIRDAVRQELKVLNLWPKTEISNSLMIALNIAIRKDKNRMRLKMRLKR